MSDLLKQAILNYLEKRRRVDGVTATPVDGLYLVKHSSPRGLEYTLVRPLICLVLQGCKQVYTAEGASSYAAGQTMVITSHMPEASRISEATPSVPYLAIALDLDTTVLTDLIISTQEVHTSQVTLETNEDLWTVFLRLARLLDRPESLAVLKDGLLREIHYWLLFGRQGASIRSLGLPDSHAQRIARAVAILRADYAQPVQIERLAAAAGMSRSAFHQHFRAITLRTPLQFQKQLRLLEARRLILKGEALIQAAFEVGYLSASQFSREYTRMFGQPPSADKKASSARWKQDSAGERC
ncbi:AraC family transcriptional regulator N-terminal domain-containing protein [Kordiimonas sp.]|uniref:AraC family transcriptional regulator n=1 Tax=Kordiimonas sp. TaxID=1970157 RepID=UPI003A92E20F